MSRIVEHNIFDWGARPDRSGAVNLAAFQAFLDSDPGACRCLMPGEYELSDTLVIDEPVRFVGGGRSRSGFTAEAGWSDSSAPLVQLGSTEPLFHCGLERMTVDGAGLTDEVVAVHILQEMSGLERVTVRGATRFGIKISTLTGSTANRVPSNFAAFDTVEVYFNDGEGTLAADAVGIMVDGAAKFGGLARGPRGIHMRGVTVNSTFTAGGFDGNGSLRSGVEVNGDGSHVTIGQTHVEGADSGVRVVNHGALGSPIVSIADLKGNASVTGALLRVQGGAHSTSARALWANGAALTVQDVDAGFSSTDDFGDYSIGSGASRPVVTTLE